MIKSSRVYPVKPYVWLLRENLFRCPSFRNLPGWGLVLTWFRIFTCCIGWIFQISNCWDRTTLANVVIPKLWDVFKIRKCRHCPVGQRSAIQQSTFQTVQIRKNLGFTIAKSLTSLWSSYGVNGQCPGCGLPSQMKLPRLPFYSGYATKMRKLNDSWRRDHLHIAAELETGDV